MRRALGPLTTRQSQVLELWQIGLSIRQIGERLHLAASTVHRHKVYGQAKIEGRVAHPTRKPGGKHR